MKRIFKSLAAMALIAGLSSCGSAGSGNDQGVSFTLYGTFRDATCSQGLTGLLVPLSSDPESNGSGTGSVAALGLQNNLAQAIRTRRVFMKYYVEGAQVQPPSTSQPLGLFLGPGTINDNSSLPDSITGGSGESAEQLPAAAASTRAIANTGCAEFFAVPSEILSYLNLNRDTLPELPYKMRVELSVYGIGTAGDEYVTNPLDLYVEVLEDNIIAPTSPDSETDESALEEAFSDESGTNTEIIPVDEV